MCPPNIEDIFIEQAKIDKEDKAALFLSKKSEQGRLDYIRHRQFKHKFNITLQDYNRMFAEQGGCCAICRRHQSEFKKRLHVDHNHKTGQIRALLCCNCNVVIGKSMESVEILAKMAEYLEKWDL